ncbi:hypothetical protein O3G_MSEX005766 [Manduca sexta]|uniref:Fucosyltransferase n=1 Tax=Manduca sexta TaxID=7130 RepID=A0A922CJZ2_MANSE|nr:hypothetical protein O3G_MSEX005766 [Manduca sexta]
MLDYIKLLLKSKWSVKNIILLILTVSVCVFIHVLIMHDLVKFVDSVSSAISFNNRQIEKQEIFKSPKYILLWYGSALVSPSEGNAVLKHLHCPVTDCIFTTNKHLLGNISNFNAIVFNENFLKSKHVIKPKVRLNSQIYTLNTVESAHNYPACELFLDDFFNWTFTYRLASDIVWSYITVTDVEGHIIAPSKSVVWRHSSAPVKPEIRSILAGKTKAAAWLVSNCNADSLRDEYVTRLQEHLFHFSLAIDIYGSCTGTKCTRGDCEEMVKEQYYFYMAFENSFAEDYVTEKVLHGYNNYAVPIVYGGANYSRFLPPGSYINAREMHPYRLALKIRQVISNRNLFMSYFTWTNLYKVTTSEVKVQHPLCHFCEALHSNRVQKAPAMKNFRFWWNGLNGMKWCLSNEYWSERNKMIIDSKDVYPLY